MMAEPKPTVQQIAANELSPGVRKTEKPDNRNGPRCITIQRSSAGFGFTLRHFIVYPPDPVSDCPEEWQRGMSAGLLDPMAPMDTIFVKHVRENGPAVKAGLSTGDQVVSVNGESVMCKSYAQVVQMIQKSGPNLQLVVQPKEHDVLQQCFADTAHNPYTNVRPVIAEEVGKPNNIMSHLPRPKPYQPFQVETKRPITSTVPLLQQPVVPKAPPPQPPSRVLSPLVTATTTTTTTTSRLDEAAQARLAAAAALVSKSVRKSADFNPSPAGSRGSLAEYPGSTTGFSAASKRSSYAGTPTCKTEFIYNIVNPSTQQFHYAIQPSETTHGSASSLQHLRDSLNSSKGSLYSAPEEQSHQQAQVMTRIKKSFEQKEEFLKRPALPYWVNVQEAQQSPPVPKEFYAQPQKFSRPVWPPVCAASTSSLDSLSESTTASAANKSLPTASSVSTKTEVITTIASIEPWSVSFTSKRATPPTSPSQSPGAVSVGSVPNTVPKPFYGSIGSPAGSKQFVTTLSRIQENIAAEPAEPAAAPNRATTAAAAAAVVATLSAMKPTTTRQLTLMQAPLASPEEFTPSPTKASQHPLATATAPVVVKRTKPFENGAERGLLARIAQRGKQQQEAFGKPSFDYHRAPTGSGNRTVIIGSSKLHCAPPSVEEYDLQFQQQQLDEDSDDDDDDDDWNEEERNKSLVSRQHSYRSAIRDFASSPLLRNDPVDENSNPTSSSTTDRNKKMRPSPLQLTGATKGPCLQTDIDAVTQERTSSPLSLPRPSPIASDFELSVLERFDQLLASLGTHSSGSSSISSSASTLPAESQPLAPKMTSTPASTASVNRRQKIYDDDSDRGMRRISYLKATAGNSLDETASSNESRAEPTTTTATPVEPKGSTPWAEGKECVVVAAGAQPVGMISRLRQYFEEKSRPPPPPSAAIKAAAASSPPLAPSRRPAHPPHSIQKLRSLFGDKVTPSSNNKGHESTSSSTTTTAHHPPSPSDSEGREGWLNVKQTIVDCRRSTDRSWRQMWTRVRGGTVHFSRGNNTSSSSNNNNNSNSYSSLTDDMVIDLRGCTVEVAVYYTKRKYVLRLSTLNGLCEYLMQCEDNNDMAMWLDAFQQEQVACDKEDGGPVMSSYSSSEMMLVRQAYEADSAHGRRMGRFTLHRNRSPTGHSPVSKTRKPSLPGIEPTPITPANAKPNTWRRKVVQQFKKIQGSSPNATGFFHTQMVPEGATIGVPLEFCPRSSLSESIPLIVELCVGIVEARGLESVGVYRVPGNSVAVNALTDSLNRGFDALNQSDPRWNDVNVISSLMKSFFRKLPDPLVTADLYAALIDASKTEPEQARLNAIKRLVEDLPEPHYSTLRYLIGHLSRVAAKSHLNKMEARNLAIVFGPTLIRPGDDSTVTMVTDMSHQCRIVETLIDKVDFFFPPEHPEVQVETSSNSPTQASNSHLDDRKDAFAKEIVSSIITAARKKRQTSLDSPDLSDRTDSAPPTLPKPAAAAAAAATIEVVASTTAPTGSAHSLVELGSTGGQPALPVEASEFRSSGEISTPPLVERKRSASLGGETAMPPPPSNLGTSELAGISEAAVNDSTATSSGPAEFRSRTSSGSFVVNKIHPIDAAGIRTYSGLSAVTQERIRLFEQETKAMLQRDLARQRREGEPARRLDKTEVETAWQRAKLEMETDDFLDVLADNPTDDPQPSDTTKPDQLVEPVETEKATAEEEPEPEEEPKPASSEASDDNLVAAGKEEKSDETPPTAQPSKSSSTAKTVKSPTTAVVKPAPKTSASSVGRSQIPRQSITKSTTESPAKSSTESTRTSPTKSITPSSTKTTTRSAMAVVGRAKTVELTAKTKKTSVGEQQAPRTVVRQMSTGNMSLSSSSPSRSLPVKTQNSRLRSTESPTKNKIVPAKTEESKKTAATTDGEQSSKRLLESNLDETNLESNVSKNGSQSKEVPEIVERPNKSAAAVVGLKPKSADSKGVKRSDSLTKDEKTENNTKAREREMRQTTGNNGGGGRLRKFVQRSESGLKRRHTVGGTRDFDKVRIRWLADKSDERNVPAPKWSAWDRLQPLISDEDLNVDRSLKTWMRSERMRTSSPELCRRSEVNTSEASPQS